MMDARMTRCFNIYKPQNVSHKDKWKDMLLKELAHTFSHSKCCVDSK